MKQRVRETEASRTRFNEVKGLWLRQLLTKEINEARLLELGSSTNCYFGHSWWFVLQMNKCLVLPRSISSGWYLLRGSAQSRQGREGRASEWVLTGGGGTGNHHAPICLKDELAGTTELVVCAHLSLELFSAIIYIYLQIYGHDYVLL